MDIDFVYNLLRLHIPVDKYDIVYKFNYELIESQHIDFEYYDIDIDGISDKINGYNMRAIFDPCRINMYFTSSYKIKGIHKFIHDYNAKYNNTLKNGHYIVSGNLTDPDCPLHSLYLAINTYNPASDQKISLYDLVAHNTDYSDLTLSFERYKCQVYAERNKYSFGITNWKG